MPDWKNRLFLATLAFGVFAGVAVAWGLPAIVDPPLLPAAQVVAVLGATVLAGWMATALAGYETERMRTVIAELEARTEEFIQAQRVAGVGHWDYDIARDELSWSEEVYRIVGVSPEDFDHNHQAFFDFVHPEDRDHLNYVRSRALAGVEPLDVVHRIVRPDGEVRWVHERGALSTGVGAEEGRIMGTVQDVTDLHLAQARERATQERLRSALRRLQTAREEERRALSRDIHDDVGAALSGVLLSFGTLRANLDASDDVEERLDEIRVELEGVVGRLRALARKMRPPLLDELGLAEALRQLVEEWKERGPISVRASIDESALPKLGPDERIQLYRLVQEALSNAMKHSDASGVQVRLAGTPAGFLLSVSDDGRGFDPERRKEGTLGLTSMEERALALGGSLDIESGDGGTRVTFSYGSAVGTKPPDSADLARSETT